MSGCPRVTYTPLLTFDKIDEGQGDDPEVAKEGEAGHRVFICMDMGNGRCRCIWKAS